MALRRRDFWDALPELRTVNLQVIADWRTVEKDDAGFVDTPYIDPTTAVQSFQTLLKDIVAPMRNIKNLRVGWAGGGEHAEGLHSRNKHVLPSPLLDEAWISNTPPLNAVLESSMPRFPHVEHLTLTNCWLTPFAVTALAKVHEKMQLAKITFDFVSLTAVPRGQPAPPANAQLQQAVQQLQQLQQQVNLPNLQNQWGTNYAAAAVGAALLNGNANAAQLATWFNNNNHPAQPNPFVPVAAGGGGGNANANANATPDWRGPHRDGSWPYLLDIISPGRNLGDFDGGAQYSHADLRRINASSLAEIQLVSCGYCRISGARFDQSAVEPAVPFHRSAWFNKKMNSLA
ncbi:hypothetical protein LTS18_000779, partial [Coniosporium uncinatum]